MTIGSLPLRRSKVVTRLQLPPISAQDKRSVGALCALMLGEEAVPPIVDLRLVSLLRAHRLLGVLCYLSEMGRVEPPSELRSLLAEHVRRSRSSSQAAAESTRRVLAVLRGVGVSASPLKGAFMGQSVYPAAWPRPMADVDILVPSEGLPSAIAALRAASYAPVDEQERFGASRRLHVDQMSDPVTQILIELHYQLAPGFTFEFLRERATIADSSLPLAVHFAHRLVDIAKDGPVRVGLLPYLDLLLLLKSSGGHESEARETGRELSEAALALLGALGLASFGASTLAHLERFCHDAGLARGLHPPASVLSRPRRFVLVDAWYSRRDALWRVRYTPRWQRRLLRVVLGRPN